MAKNSTNEVITDIRKSLENKRLVLGTDRTLKNLKLGKLETIYITLNCPDDIKADLEHYSKIAKIKIVQLDIPNDELGTMCKKPFSISMAGLLRV